jgi:hypothetical protein
MSQRPISGFPSYSIERDGTVYSTQRKVKRVKKQTLGNHGYFIVSLWNKNAERKACVHRLVLETFVSACPEGCEALHINGDRRDNRLGNLRWGTRKENVQDMIAHGTACLGAANGGAKLTENDVFHIRLMKGMGFSYKQLKTHFPVAEVTLIRAATRQTYKEIA